MCENVFLPYDWMIVWLKWEHLLFDSNELVPEIGMADPPCSIPQRTYFYLDYKFHLICNAKLVLLSHSMLFLLENVMTGDVLAKIHFCLCMCCFLVPQM